MHHPNKGWTMWLLHLAIVTTALFSIVCAQLARFELNCLDLLLFGMENQWEMLQTSSNHQLWEPKMWHTSQPPFFKLTTTFRTKNNGPGHSRRSSVFSTTTRSYSALKATKCRWNGVSPKVMAAPGSGFEAQTSCVVRELLVPKFGKMVIQTGKALEGLKCPSLSWLELKVRSSFDLDSWKSSSQEDPGWLASPNSRKSCPKKLLFHF